MKRILIATDGSAGAWAAVEDGVELASELGAAVTFVTVRHDPALLGEPLYQHRLTAQLAVARAALDRAERHAATRGVPADSAVLEGDPAACIADAALARDVDLVVVGCRGHGALTSALVGSVSRSLIERSPVPVLVVRDRERARSAA
jgi:nucleotide-binding universal stress UspA family protein